ncbi:MAG: hypothetical protein U9R75_05270 [Candidatus Thermoplasmatota archaeon]|nr:hypothetical protein [Candidatus Thermoplasmatota archaeon]
MPNEKVFMIQGVGFRLPEPPASPIFPWETEKTPIIPGKRVLRRKVKRKIVK